MTRGAGKSRKTSRTIGWAGLRKATSPFGEINDLASAGRRLYRPSATVREKTSVAGPGQSRQAIRRPTCEMCGTQSVTSSGPFKSKVNGPGRLGLAQRSHPRHALGIERASRQPIDRFGRQAHHAALRQTGDGAMDHIAEVVGLRHVDPLRRNRRVSHRTLAILGFCVDAGGVVL